MIERYSGVTISVIEGKRVEMPKVYLENEVEILKFIAAQTVFYDDILILFEPEGQIAIEIRDGRVVYPEGMITKLGAFVIEIRNKGFH